MTAIYKVADAIAEHTPIRLDSLAEMLPGMTQQQVARAAANAAMRGLCHCARVVTTEEGRRFGIWAAGPKPYVDPPRGDFGIPRINSVWALGTAAT